MKQNKDNISDDNNKLFLFALKIIHILFSYGKKKWYKNIIRRRANVLNSQKVVCVSIVIIYLWFDKNNM